MKNALKITFTGKAHPQSIAKLGMWHDKAIGPLIVVCLMAWCVGVVTPLMTVQKFIIQFDTYSILTFIKELYGNHEWFLLVMVILFGLVAPYIKLDQQYRVWSRYAIGSLELTKAVKRVELISKWAMTDVFAVAVLLVIAKTSGFLADASIEPGLYFFMGASIGSMLLSMKLNRAVARLAANEGI